MILNLCRRLISKASHDKAFHNEQYAKGYISFCTFWVFCMSASSDISCAQWEQFPNLLILTLRSYMTYTSLSWSSKVMSFLSWRCLVSLQKIYFVVVIVIASYFWIFMNSSKLLSARGKGYQSCKHYSRCHEFTQWCNNFLKFGCSPHGHLGLSFYKNLIYMHLEDQKNTHS